MDEINISALSTADRERLEEADVDFPVYYIGKQWAVTAYGIEHIRSHERDTPYYSIAADQLGQEMGVGGWQEHMASKQWVDAADFAHAFEIAKKVHK